MLAVSPCQKVRKPAKHNSRARVLTDAELVKVWRSFEAEGYPFGYMGKLLMLTGQRRGEVTRNALGPKSTKAQDMDDSAPSSPRTTASTCCRFRCSRG